MHASTGRPVERCEIPRHLLHRMTTLVLTLLTAVFSICVVNAARSDESGLSGHENTKSPKIKSSKDPPRWNLVGSRISSLFSSHTSECRLAQTSNTLLSPRQRKGTATRRLENRLRKQGPMGTLQPRRRPTRVEQPRPHETRKTQRAGYDLEPRIETPGTTSQVGPPHHFLFISLHFPAHPSSCPHFPTHIPQQR